MSEAELHECIARVLSGQTRSGDRESLQKWLDRSEENRELFQHLVQNWKTPFSEQPEVLGAAEVLDKILHRARGEHPLRNADRHPRRRGMLYKAAAVALVLAVSALLLYWLMPYSEQPPAIVSMTERANDAGRRSVIHLRDGSTVYLNAASSIRYPEVFADSIRHIWLQGEAFFDVAHNPEKPFVVHCGTLDVVVMGTTFNINAHDAEDLVDISLLTGSIRVQASDVDEGLSESSDSYMLEPGQQLRYSKPENRTLDVVVFDREKVTGWTEGVLCFRSADLETLVRELELWYGVDIEVINPGHNRARAMRYTGKFRNQNLQNVLESVGFVQNFDYAIDDRKIRIMFN